MIVLVCGGRSYEDRGTVWRHLDAFLEEGRFCVLEGGATGVDTHTKEWAYWRGQAHMQMKAQWDTLGKKAGPIRNEWMLKYGRPDLVLAFPGGRGTANMVKLAEEAGIEVRKIT